MTTPTPTNLETLLEAIRAGAYTEQQMTELPTFGGEEPLDTDGIWSWDETRLIVGLCAEDMRIIDRRARARRGA